MFCPEGYVPVSEVELIFNEWLTKIVEASVLHGDPFGLKGKSQRQINGICTYLTGRELSFYLSNCSSTSICEVDGTVLKIDKLIFLCRTDLYWTDDWYPPRVKHNHTRFFFVRPEVFTISLAFWENTLSELLEANINDDWDLYNTRAEQVERFEGWALCVKDEDEASIPTYILDRFELPESLLAESNLSSKGGRPPLSKAKAKFEELGYEKGSKSWEQIARMLERQTGEKPSPKTLRDWRKAGTSNLSPEEN